MVNGKNNLRTQRGQVRRISSRINRPVVGSRPRAGKPRARSIRGSIFKV